MTLPDIKTANIEEKRVFLRADLNVPLSEDLKIEDDTRLLATLPTAKYLLEKASKVFIASHLGRPNGKDNSLSLLPVATWFNKQLTGNDADLQIKNINGFDGWEITPKLFLLENLRFDSGEEDNSDEFAKKLASLADIYVNDAFGVAHRENASVVGITKFLPHFAGFLLQKEIEVLSRIIEEPQRPLVVIVGGAKIETKLPLIDKMDDFADYVLVGGKIAQETETLLNLQHEKGNVARSALLIAKLKEDGIDITEASVEYFLSRIELAKTVVWNGPVGKTEDGEVASRGSKAIAEGILKSGAYSVVGGGDTLSFLKKEGLLDKFSFYSTGGGAMLAFLSGEKLPGIEALIS